MALALHAQSPQCSAWDDTVPRRVVVPSQVVVGEEVQPCREAGSDLASEAGAGVGIWGQ